MSFGLLLAGLAFGGLFTTSVATATAGACETEFKYVRGLQVHTILDTGSCTWTAPAGVTSIDVQIVGGGGGGAFSEAGGGGGAGGQYVRVDGIAVTPNQTLTVLVGDGGAGGAGSTTRGNFGSDGQNSSLGTFVATGGKGGEVNSSNLLTLATPHLISKGGEARRSSVIAANGAVATTVWAGGAGTLNASAPNPGSGTHARLGGGGAGTGAVGGANGLGGVGVTSTFDYSGTFYGGGGGGHRERTTGFLTAATGGNGGGGNGGLDSSVLPVAGVDGHGGGGGARGGQRGITTTLSQIATHGGADGGSGQVAIRYFQPEVLEAPMAIGLQSKNVLTWTRSQDAAATGYRIIWSTNRAAIDGSTTLPTPITVTGAGTLFHTHTGLTNGTKYYYRIATAFTNVANGTGISPYSPIVEVTPQLTNTVRFESTRATQSFVVPDGVNWIEVEAKGAAGGYVSGGYGRGGTAKALIPVTPGETLTVLVGSQPQLFGGDVVWGFNGGGKSTFGAERSLTRAYAGGGGATDLRRGSELADRLIVAGGGGGHAGTSAGYNDGLLGTADSGNGSAGGGQSANIVWPAGAGNASLRTPGSLGIGANSTGGGGGGGGYYGGSAYSNFGGGAGSSFVQSEAVAPVFSAGNVLADGSLSLTFVYETRPLNAMATALQNSNLITWDASNLTGMNAYLIYGGTSPNPTTLLTQITGTNLNSLQYLHTGLTNGTKYYYRVAAKTATAGEVSAFSDEVSAIPAFMAEIRFESIRAAQEFVVPEGVNWIEVEARSAAGGYVNGGWGKGGTAKALIPVTPGETLQVNVGSQPLLIGGEIYWGFNGGGTSQFGGTNLTSRSYAGGGGATDLRRGTSLEGRLIVAGGGGGHAGTSGGHNDGLFGTPDSSNGSAGGGQSADITWPVNGITPSLRTNGIFGQGANSTNGAGGGGGYYGGSAYNNFGGGAGSSYIQEEAVAKVFTSGNSLGDGYLTIRYPTKAYPEKLVAVPMQLKNVLSWETSQVSGLASYRIYWGTTPNPTTLLTSPLKAATTYTHTGLTNGTTYYYRISAFVGGVETEKSAIVSATPNTTVTTRFDVTRATESFVVPAGVSWIEVEANGAAGGYVNYGWGRGGTAKALIPVTPGETLTVLVGSQPTLIGGEIFWGFNGGGTSNFSPTNPTSRSYAGGGGATDLRRGNSLADRLIVAGAGGGHAGTSGGYNDGLFGTPDSSNGAAGGGQSAEILWPVNGTNQSLRTSGAFGRGANSNTGGGGGGGYYGGSAYSNFGGGAGSSYIFDDAVAKVFTAGNILGDGSLEITYIYNEPVTNLTAMPGDRSVQLSWDRHPMTGVTGYRVFGGPTPNPTTVLGTTVNNFYNHTSLTNGTTYYYRVEPYGTGVTGARSQDVSATPTNVTVVSFAATGASQNFQVPPGVSYIQVEAIGAAGGYLNGGWGRGGTARATLSVIPGEVLQVNVGTQPKVVSGSVAWGFNGGGTSQYGGTNLTQRAYAGGGGATDIRRGSAIEDRLLIAGGGGGHAGTSGGHNNGIVGTPDSGNGSAGGGQSNEILWPSAGTNQSLRTDGAFGQGANSNLGGGGGGGYYGGSAYNNFGGGAGSSWVTPGAYNIQYVGSTGTGEGRMVIRYSIDTTNPTVTGISSPLPTGTYREGTEVFIDVNFSEPVFVDGAPTLDLNVGSRNPVTLTYLSGSGTSTLRFKYSIISGDDTSSLPRSVLDVSGTDALKLNGATIADPAGNIANVALPAPGSLNSLGVRKSLVIDGLKPLPPQLVAVSGSAQIGLQWIANTEPDLKEYRIYVSTDQQNYSQLGTSVKPLTTFTQKIVATGIVYYYYITAVDVNGNESDPSEIVSWFIPTPGAISVPSMVIPSPTNSTSPVVSGVADPNVTVLIYRNESGSEVFVGSTTTAENGRYSFTMPGPLAEGGYSLSARASSSALISSRTTIRPLIVDLTAPGLTSITRLNPSTEQTAASALVWRLTFTEEMRNLSPSDFVLSKSTAQVTTITRNQFNSLQWDVAVSGGNLGSVTGAISIGFIGSPGLTDLAGNSLGSTSPTGVNHSYVIDRSNPTPVITSVAASLGGSNPTTSITISLDFNASANFTVEDISVVGGTLSQFSGSGQTFSAVLTATAGFEGVGRISIRAGAFTSEAGNTNRASPEFTLPIDMIAPAAISVDRFVLNGAYGVGAEVDLVVNFSEHILVTGNPRLLLETGSVDRHAVFLSATQSNAIFRYTVQAGDNSADLNYHSVNALDLDGGVISDLVGNAAAVVLPGLTTPEALASRAALVIDTAAPNAPGLPTLTIAGGKLVTNFINSTNTNIAAQVAVTAADYTFGGRAELLANGVVVASTSTMISPISIPLGTTTAQALQALIPTGSVNFAIRVFDGAGNFATSSVAVRTVDFVAPRATITSSAPSPIGSSQFNVLFGWSETVTGFNCAVNTTYTLISGANCVQTGDTFSRIVTPTANTEGVIRVEMVASNISTGVYDAAGNPALAAAPLSLILDSRPPTILRVEKITPDGTYGIATNIDFRVVFNEPVVLSSFDASAPSMTLNAKTGAKAFVLSTTSDSIIFRYTVQAGDSTADLNYVGTNALALGSFSVRDAGNNNAVLALPDPTLPASLGGGANYILDGVAPDAATLSSLTATGSNVVPGFVNGTNSNVEVTVNFTKNQALGGRVDLKVGNTVVLTRPILDATAVPMTLGLGTTTPAQLQQIIAEGAASFSAVLYDSVGNFASSTEVGLLVDYVAPILTGSVTPNRTLGFGDVANLLVSSSESVLYRGAGACGDGLFNLVGGTVSCVVWPASAVSGVNSVQLSFSPSVQGGWSVTFLQGALADRAGNSSVAFSLNGTADTVPPTVLSVRALSADATYKVGQRISINVNFDEIVNVTAPVSLSLAVASGVARDISYTSGTGTATLRFDYVVQAGDSTADLDFSGAGALQGVVKDLANNQANLGLGGIPTLASAAQLVVDGAQPNQPIGTPVFSGFAAGVDQGAILNSLTTNLTAAISLSPQANISRAELLLGGVVIAVDTDVDNQSNASFDLGASSNATIQDIISGAASLTVRTVSVGGNISPASAPTALVPDYVKPGVSITANNQSLSAAVVDTQLTFTLTESSTNFVVSDVVVLGGTLTDFAGSGSSYTATFTPAVGGGDWSARIVAGAFTDASGNPGEGSNILRGSADLVAPTIAALTYQSATGTYRAGQTLLVEVRFSEAVVVSGTPVLPLLAGATCAEVNASYLSGSGTTRLVFQRTVQAGEFCSNVVESGTALALNGGSILDAAGNPANLNFTPQLASGRNVNAVTPAAPLAPIINTDITSSTIVVDDSASSMNIVVGFGGSRAYAGEVKLFIGQTLFATASFAVNASSVTFTLAANTQLQLQGILEPLIPASSSQNVRAEVSDTDGNFATSPVTALTALWSATYAQKASAQASISTFVASPFPTTESYKVAGVSGVSDENVDLLNQVLAGLPESMRDNFPAELDAIVAVLNSIKAVADDTNGSFTPVTAADLALLCASGSTTALCTITSAAELALVNSLLAEGSFDGANSMAELERIAQFAKNVIAGVRPSVADFVAMGFANVTAGDLALIWAQIMDSPGGAAGRDSFDEIANLIEIALAKKTALALLANYDASSASAPTLQTYLDAGIDGVNSANLATLNALLRDLGPEKTTTPEQLQELVALANRLLNLADGSKDGESHLTATDVATLGLGSVGNNSATLSLLNSAIDGKNISDVDSIAKLQAIADVVAEIARLATLNPDGSNAPATSLTAAQLDLIGITFSAPVTLADVLYAIAASANDLSGITDLNALNAAIAAGVKARGELAAVGALLSYSLSDAVAPTAANYAAAGITGVTANNLAMLNNLIGSGQANPSDAAELQALVDALNKLLAGADGIVNDGSNLTAADFATLGLSAVNTGLETEIANGLLDGMNAQQVSTSAALTAFASAVVKLAATADATSGANAPAGAAALTVADLLALGVTGVTEATLAAVIAAIVADSGASNLANSKVTSLDSLQQLVNAAIAQGVLDLAAASIAAFTGTGTAPTVSDYRNAGVIGVTDSNLNLMNSFVGPLAAGVTDSQAELKALADALVKLRAAANQSDDNSSNLTAVELEILGVTASMSAGVLALVNNGLDVANLVDVDSPSELASLVALAQALFSSAASGTTAALNVADLARLGLTGVTEANLAAILALVRTSNADGSGLDSIEKINALISAANNVAVAQAALAKISQYEGNPALQVSDYLSAGVTSFSPSLISSVNSFVAELPVTQSQTLEQIQAVSDAVNKLRSLADGTPGTGAEMTPQDLSALGFGAISATELALLNSILDRMNFSLVDSHEELAAIIAKVKALLAAADSGAALTTQDFLDLGFATMTAEATGFLNERIAATANDGSGVNSFAKLDELVQLALADAKQAEALSVITDFTGSNQAPILADYLDSLITGVISANLAIINSFFAGVGAADSNTAQKIQAVVDAVNALITGADTVVNGSAAIDNDDLSALAIASTSAEVLALVNDRMDVLSFASVDSAAKLRELVLVAKAIIALTDSQATASPTVADFELMGITGVSAANLGFLTDALSGRSAGELASVAGLQSLIDTAVADYDKLAALAEITQYDGSDTAPSRDTYLTAQIANVTDGNLSMINSFIAQRSVSETNTAQKIQALVDAVNKLRSGVNPSLLSSASMTQAELEALDVAVGSNLNALQLMNSILAGLSIDQMNTFSELDYLAEIVEAIMQIAAGVQPSKILTDADLALIGLTGVTSGNLSLVLSMISQSASDGSGANLVAKLQQLVVAAANPTGAAAAQAIIENFDGNNQQPTAADYAATGVFGVDAENLALVNAIVGPALAVETNTFAKVQAIVDALAKLSGLVDGVVGTGLSLTIEDLRTLGLDTMGLEAAELRLLNSALDRMFPSQADSAVELQAAIDSVIKLMVIASGGEPVNALSAEDFVALGVTGVNQDNLLMVRLKIEQTAADGSGADTHAKLTAMIQAVNAEIAAASSLPLIVNFVENGGGNAPAAIDYSLANIEMTSENSIGIVNQLLSLRSGTEVDTRTKLQALVSVIANSHDAITSFAEARAGAPTLAHFRALGITGLNAQNLAGMNALIAGMDPSELSTLEAIQSLVANILTLAAPTAPGQATSDAPTGGSSAGGTLNPVGLAPTEVSEVAIVETATGLVIGFEVGSRVRTLAIRLIDSSGKVRQLSASAANSNATLLEIEKGRSYRVEITPILEDGSEGSVYKTTFASKPNAPADIDMQREVGGRVGISWTEPSGFVASYKILVQQRGKIVQEILTNNRSALLAPFAGLARVSIYAFGEGGSEVVAGVAVVSSKTVVGAVTARHATRGNNSLLSFNAGSTGTPTYKVYVNGTLVCSTKNTSCTIKQRVGALDKLRVVSNDGAISPMTNYFEAINFTGQVSFQPNSVRPAAGFTAALNRIVANIRSNKFTNVVVTGHANQVGVIQTSSAARLARLRGEYVADLLRQLLPGVRVVSVDRGVASPLVPRSSAQNIRAEIYSSK